VREMKAIMVAARLGVQYASGHAASGAAGV
jgi:hypothetical protein